MSQRTDECSTKDVHCNAIDSQANSNGNNDVLNDGYETDGPMSRSTRDAMLN